MKGNWLRKGQGRAAVVFVHGINSSAEDCWRHRNGTYWPTLLLQESDLSDVGIYEFSYLTDVFSGNYSLNDIADALTTFMRLDEVSDLSVLIFVCHSLGGIVVRRYILQNQADLIARHLEIGLFLVASPSLGAGYANFLSDLARPLRNSQLKTLCSGENNIWLDQLDRDFMSFKDMALIQIHGKELVEHKFCTKKFLFFLPRIVPPYSGHRYFGQHFKVPDSDHRSIAKPENAAAIQHRLLCEFIQDRLNLNKNPNLYPLDRLEAERAAHLLKALVERPKDESPGDFQAALQEVHQALRETRLYLKCRSKGEYRDAVTEERLMRLWSDAADKLYPFDPNLANLCYVKGHGWADNTVWDDPRFKDLPLKLNDILEQTLLVKAN